MENLLVVERSGGSAKEILLLVQRNQILLARTYFHWENTPGRMSMYGAKSHSACHYPLEFSSGSLPALQLLCGFALLWNCFLSVKFQN